MDIVLYFLSFILLVRLSIGIMTLLLYDYFNVDIIKLIRMDDNDRVRDYLWEKILQEMTLCIHRGKRALRKTDNNRATSEISDVLDDTFNFFRHWAHYDLHWGHQQRFRTLEVSVGVVIARIKMHGLENIDEIRKFQREWCTLCLRLALLIMLKRISTSMPI